MRFLSVFFLIASYFMSGVAWAGGSSNSHIRTLAASCAVCHGYEGKSHGDIPSLAGMPSRQFLDRMQKYRDMQDDGSVMNQHAKGLTWQEITGLAGHFACIAPKTNACQAYHQQAGEQ